MSNEIKFKSGNGINISADSLNKTLTFASTIDENKLKALNNANATETNPFLTKSEIESLIATAISGGSGNYGNAPAGFPKFFTTSIESFVIPKTGKYRISMVGGGAAGGVGSVGSTFVNGNAGASTLMILRGSTHVAPGGNGSVNEKGGSASIPYDGTKGSVKGGDGGINGDTGAGQGGIVRNNYNYWGGGGGGSPLNYNVNAISGESAQGHYSSSSVVFSEGGKGYGAGGAGAPINRDVGYSSGQGAGGGASGYLVIEELTLNENEAMKIVIGAGGIKRNGTNVSSGNGAQGAVLIEWVE